MAISPTPEFFIKASSYCNLRCDYCYEFPHLGDRTRMSINNVRALFANTQNSVDDLGIEHVDFIWHGGEPFLIPVEFYEQIDSLQAEVFRSSVRYANRAQTNLTVLTERHIRLLLDGFFSNIGVSFDVYGDQRVDIKGRSRNDRVMANLQTLIDNNIAFGAIVVLARNTLPSAKQIFPFFRRFIPILRLIDGRRPSRGVRWT
jgi:uncharacterized protein